MNDQHSDLDIIQYQPTFNIVVIGHVSHGKTTLVKALTNTNTKRFKKELEGNKTIQLGYANIKLHRCPDCHRYKSTNSSVFDCVCDCGKNMMLVMHASFVDCPGHNSLISTMLTGASVSDEYLLLIDGKSDCPQPQTMEHINIMRLMGTSDLIVLQNKIDCITKEQAIKSYKQIHRFMKGMNLSGPVIPISSVSKLNISAVCRAIHTRYKMPERNPMTAPKFAVIRSFDINRGKCTDKGGVIGGSLLCGKISVGDKLCIYPGDVVIKDRQVVSYCPIETTVISMMSEKNPLKVAYPGGLIGICTTIPAIKCKRNGLVGSVVCGGQYEGVVARKLRISFVPISLDGKSKQYALNKRECVRMHVGPTICVGRVIDVEDMVYVIALERPGYICICPEQKVTILKKIHSGWRVVGYGPASGLDLVPCV